MSRCLQLFFEMTQQTYIEREMDLESEYEKSLLLNLAEGI